jgi:hypothetical protein
MSETTFENAKVGDRVWSVGMGWGEIVQIEERCIYVSFGKTSPTIRYTKHGREHIDVNQTLFWDEIKIVPPLRPKRKVTKTVERWAVISIYDGYTTYYEEDINHYYEKFPIEFKVVKLTGTYEVEE